MKEIIKKLIAFRDERNWEDFHTPPNLARSIMIEGAELNRNFQWGPEWKSPDIENVADEVADVMIYCLTMCHELGVDPEKIILQKIEKNGIKYPVKP
jgi:NTP pyrophosphatase (non-canonical NTP hydrolase)